MNVVYHKVRLFPTLCNRKDEYLRQIPSNWTQWVEK